MVIVLFSCFKWLLCDQCLASRYNKGVKSRVWSVLKRSDLVVQVVPYLNFPNTKEVLAFYEKLGANVKEMILANDAIFADMPENERPDNPSNFVMNASIEVLGNVIFMSDSWGNKAVDHEGANLSFVFDQNDATEVARVKDFFQQAIELGCEETMPLAPSGWSELFGIFKDPYGISWMFSGE